jgi:[protein-PII] uridylyltransferase
MQRYPAIERALRKAIAGESDIASLVERWRTRNAPRQRKSINHAFRRNLPQVECDNSASQLSTLVQVHAVDEPGLVYKIASALATLGLDIVCARIATEKSDALDVFYVTDGKGMKLSPALMQSVKDSLSAMLSSEQGIKATSLE